MSMIRKIIPVSLYDIPGLEGWLEEQASQGLFPTSFYIIWCVISSGIW